MDYQVKSYHGLIPLLLLQLTSSHGQKFMPLTNRFKEDPFSGKSQITPYGYRATFRDSDRSGGFTGQGQRSRNQRSGETQNTVISYQTYDPRVLSSLGFQPGKEHACYDHACYCSKITQDLLLFIKLIKQCPDWCYRFLSLKNRWLTSIEICRVKCKAWLNDIFLLWSSEAVYKVKILRILNWKYHCGVPPGGQCISHQGGKWSFLLFPWTRPTSTKICFYMF